MILSVIWWTPIALGNLLRLGFRGPGGINLGDSALSHPLLAGLGRGGTGHQWLRLGLVDFRHH